MRLRRLDLSRYGKFTDRGIDFGETAEGQPDLHIVYGPNEAGKSTALGAFLDFLFGIEPRSRFNFLHPYSTMRIGACLELFDRAVTLVRVKRAHGSLLDSSDQPVSDALVLEELAGIDRESYRTMFSLDDESLEVGGESILASKGDLGQLLFSASAGLADLGRNLVEIRAEADRFYKYRARGGELAELKARLATLREERERVDTFAAQYANLVVQRDRARGQYQEALDERARLNTRIDEIARMLSTLPRLADLRDFRRRLAPLAELPDAPLGWAEQLPGLQRDEIALAERAQAIEGEIARLTAERDAIDIDRVALAMADRIERLADLRARYITAEKDIPERQLQLREVELVIAGILERLECGAEPDPARLVLTASVTAALRGLMERRSGIEAASRAAENELAAARHGLAEATRRLDEAGGRADAEAVDPSKLSSLVTAVAAVRADDHAARRRLATRSRSAGRQALDERLAELRPWQGDVEQLAGLALPDAVEIERWKKTAADLEKRLDGYEADIGRWTVERDRLVAARDAIGATGVVGDQEAGDVRTEREQAWARHRRTLDEASADAFERTLRRDDLVTMARLAHTSDLARLQQTIQALADVNAKLDRAGELRAAAEKAREQSREEVAGSLRSASSALSDRMSLSQLESWLARRDKALEAGSAVGKAERELSEAEMDAATAQERLSSALRSVGLSPESDATVEALLAMAQAAIDREVALQRLRGEVDDRRRELGRREQELEAAAQQERRWGIDWEAACGRCWLGDSGAAPALGTVREVLATLADLAPALQKRAGLADRIGKMQTDQAAFATELEVITQDLGFDPSDMPVLDLARTVERRIKQASAAELERAARQRSLEEATNRKRKLADDLAIHAKRKAELTRFFGVETLVEVGEKLRDIATRASIRDQAALAERDILNNLRVATLDEAEPLLESFDQDALEVEFAELKPRLVDQDQRCRDVFSSFSKAGDAVAAVGGDDAVARIEEQRRTIQLEVEEKAERYLKLRLGAAAANHALRVYRETHHSSMMARASEAFCTISRGAYARLATQPDKDGEMLIAVAADGRSKMAVELSRGARFQLYLALRVAGYHEFVRSRRPVPFIADDIMESFDDFRAEEAFRLFADMAGVGQVIYLTHHRHLCDIARRVCPGARVHELGDGAITREGSP